MTTVISQASRAPEQTSTSRRANALAERLEQGARALEGDASSLTDTMWQTRIPGDGRKIGVVVHHVATMYPLEIQLAQLLAAGKPIADVTWDAVHELNANHASANNVVTMEAALDLLRRNWAAAAAGIRAMSDEESRELAAEQGVAVPIKLPLVNHAPIVTMPAKKLKADQTLFVNGIRRNRNGSLAHLAAP